MYVRTYARTHVRGDVLRVVGLPACVAVGCGVKSMCVEHTR